MSDAQVPPRWRILLTPRWLCWHLFAAGAVAGMIWLSDWQLRRALAGNALSWAYTFEWPIFAIFGVVFWVKTIRDELRAAPGRGAGAGAVELPAGAAPAGNGSAVAAGDGKPGNGKPGEDTAGDGQERADVELAEYNAYLARLGSQVKGHGRWHGLR